MRSKKRVNIRAPEFNLALWMLERRSDTGPMIQLLRFLYGTVEDYVVRYALGRSARSQEVKTFRQGRKTFYQAASSPAVGETVSAKLERQRRTWDGRWSLVNYDLPERPVAPRKRLVRAMRALGLGMWSQSTWISPYDWSEALDRQAEAFGAGEYLGWARGADLKLREDSADFAGRIWRLDSLAERYRALIDECGRITRLDLSDPRRHRPAVRRAFRACEAWMSVRADDAMLPAELLPPKWPAASAERAIAGVRRKMADLAATW